MTTVSCVALVRVPELTVIPMAEKARGVTEFAVIPLPKNSTDGGVQVPLWNLRPTIETFALTEPRPIEPAEAE